MLFFSQQELNILKDIFRQNVSGHIGELCTALLSNEIGGPGSPLSLNPNVPAQRRPLLELLVHASAVFYSGNRLLRPLHRISSQPQNVTVRIESLFIFDIKKRSLQCNTDFDRVFFFPCFREHSCPRCKTTTPVMLETGSGERGLRHTVSVLYQNYTYVFFFNLTDRICICSF